MQRRAHRLDTIPKDDSKRSDERSCQPNVRDYLSIEEKEKRGRRAEEDKPTSSRTSYLEKPVSD